VHEVLVVVDLEQRLGGLDHLPHHDRGDLDRLPTWSFTLSFGVSKFRTRCDTLRLVQKGLIHLKPGTLAVPT